MSKAGLEYLFNQYIQNNSTPEERKELMELLSMPENEAVLSTLVTELLEKNTEPEFKMTAGQGESLLKNILQAGKATPVAAENKRMVFGTWWRVAAAVLLLYAGAAYWTSQKAARNADEPGRTVKIRSDILPGGNRALLTMSGGARILLDNAPNGEIAQQGGVRIRKQGGMLVYETPRSVEAGSLVYYNEISTPRGGQFEIVLSDGTKVWLNAASSLRYPAAFTGDLRQVELTGEGYFEVAANRQKPFQVLAREMKVNVLGTHFNVMAYEDEGLIKTSLLEGSVKITHGKANGILRPGQQAVVKGKEENIVIENADLSGAVAWKNGLLQFENADIRTIMREISRWYDVEIVYAGKVPQEKLEGKISKKANLSEILQILEFSNIQCKVEGKKLIIL